MSKNYLESYSKKAKKFQAGGEMPSGEAPQEGGGDLQAMLMEFAESQDPQLAVAICNSLLEQIAASQGAAPGGAAPNGATPAYRHGGRLHVDKPIFTIK